jgi:hypothetical protein
VTVRFFAVTASVLVVILVAAQFLRGEASLPTASIELLGFAVIIHAYVLGTLAVKRDPRLNYLAATFCIFFSGMWFIGPITYFSLRKKYPFLARCCIRQLAAFTVFWVGGSLIHDHLQPHLPVFSASTPPAAGAHQ